jgi:hypothetical protein
MFLKILLVPVFQTGIEVQNWIMLENITILFALATYHWILYDLLYTFFMYDFIVIPLIL